MRPSSTSCATSSRRKSRTPGRSDSGTSVSRTRRPTPVDGFTWGNPRRYVYRKAASSSEMVQSLNDQTTVSCPVCGHYNDADATVCGACAFALNHLSPEEKVDAILEDLLDLSKAPMAEEKPVSSPTPEEPDVDEVAAEQLFDSLLIEIQPSPAEEAAEDRSVSEEVAETPPAREAPADAVPIPVLATPAETEGRKMIRISGRMFDGVTYASVGALVAVFIFFRMYANPFDLSAPLPIVLFAAIAGGGMIAALLLFRISNSAVAQGDHLGKRGRYQRRWRAMSGRFGWSGDRRTHGRPAGLRCDISAASMRRSVATRMRSGWTRRTRSRGATSGRSTSRKACSRKPSTATTRRSISGPSTRSRGTTRASCTRG